MHPYLMPFFHHMPRVNGYVWFVGGFRNLARNVNVDGHRVVIAVLKIPVRHQIGVIQVFTAWMDTPLPVMTTGLYMLNS